MDSSGISSKERCKRIDALKKFLNEKVNVLHKLTRPGPAEITAELYQMLHCTLDSHLVSFLNIEFFNPRRKSTGSVEQFFSQITLMNEGGMKLNCDVISDILERVMITNALKLIPISVKGFSFLKFLKLHMTSYTEKSDDNKPGVCKPLYPSISCWDQKRTLEPLDSEFDRKVGKKRKFSFTLKETQPLPSGSSDGAVRKFHRKF